MAKDMDKRDRPAINPDARRMQMAALAEQLAEKQLRDGTATSQVIVHYLKEGSLRYEQEIEKLKRENELLKAKTKAIEAESDMQKLLEEATSAFKNYGAVFRED